MGMVALSASPDRGGGRGWSCCPSDTVVWPCMYDVPCTSYEFVVRIKIVNLCGEVKLAAVASFSTFQAYHSANVEMYCSY